MTDGCLKRLVGFHLLGAFITDTAWRRERDSRQGTARHGTARLGVGVAVAVAVGVGMKREEEEGQGAAIAPHPPADDGGSRPAMASLAFRNLTVRSAGRERGSPLSLGGRIMGALGRAHPRDEAFTALKGAEGLMKPGTMMLVMGPPGSGKSSLLRALAGRLHPTEDLMSGDMAIDGVRVDSSHPSHSRRVVYVPPDDTSHTPAMTVRETFEFAAKCCGNSEMTDRVVEGFGLTRVADTVVGGDELRGVSGGQKRRVTVGEMAFSSDALFFCLDSITNGLDSATAYQVVKLCEKACRTQSKAAALSLLQPPQEVFDLFESVICLTPVGDMAFYGPRSAAVAYFEAATGSSCPAGMTSPEFIQSILSGLVPLRPLSSVTSSDRKQDSVPTLAGLWAGQSPARAELDGLLNEAFAAGEDRPPLTNPPSFRHGFWKQMELCLGRRFIVVLRNEMTVRRPIVALLFGLVTGTLFFQLPNNLMGTISASGLLFLSLFLTLMLSAAVVLPGNFRQRVTYFKHRNAGFYSTPAYYLSTWISDLPLAILEALLLSLVTYFLAGLRPGAQFYFFFFGILVATECVGQAWGRLISALCPSEVMANVLTTGYIFTCGLVSGFMPGYNALGWAKFLNWLSPVSYGFEAIMLNQFSGRPVYLFLGINGDLEASEISIPGTDMLSAAWNVPRIPFDEAPPGMRSPAQLKAFDMAMMFIFSLVLDASACYLLDVSRRWYGPRARRVQLEMGGGIIKDVLPCQGGEEVSGEPPSSTAAAVVEEDVMLTAASLIYEVDVPKGNEDEKPEQDKEEKDAQESLEDGAVASASTGSQASSEGDQSLSTPDTNATYGQRRNLTLQWGLTYILNAHRFLRRRGNDHKKGSKAPTKQGTKRLRLLDQVTVAFKGGEMTALMGESGAGKTTLLDVIAGYKTGGHITGDIRINGRPKDVATWQRTSGYCEQSDIHNPYLSLRESLEFGASCRLPAKMTEKERHTRVDEVIDLMQLREYESMVIGSEANGEGLPKHARKRLTIALELIPGPKVLFLDEPTTGLDGISARLVMSSVRQSSDRLRVCVVCTIHQPSRSLFESEFAQPVLSLLFSRGSVSASSLKLR
jgi:ABC-type multidrug transport system ATPase subunit